MNLSKIKNFILPSLCLLGIVLACEPSSNSAKNGYKQTKTLTICFRKVSGTVNQDTAIIQLNITGDSVSGNYSNMPFEKDAMHGNLLGSRKNETITAVWTYSQEGMLDTITTSFKIHKGRLFQKPFKFDPNSGRRVMDNSSDFTIRYEPTDCIQGNSTPNNSPSE